MLVPRPPPNCRASSTSPCASIGLSHWGEDELPTVAPPLSLSSPPPPTALPGVARAERGRDRHGQSAELFGHRHSMVAPYSFSFFHRRSHHRLLLGLPMPKFACGRPPPLPCPPPLPSGRLCLWAGCLRPPRAWQWSPVEAHSSRQAVKPLRCRHHRRSRPAAERRRHRPLVLVAGPPQTAASHTKPLIGCAGV
jgi:hypothetical protein